MVLIQRFGLRGLSGRQNAPVLGDGVCVYVCMYGTLLIPVDVTLTWTLTLQIGIKWSTNSPK